MNDVVELTKSVVLLLIIFPVLFSVLRTQWKTPGKSDKLSIALIKFALPALFALITLWALS